MLVYEEYCWGGVNNYLHHLSSISIHRPPVAGVDLAFDSEHVPGPKSNF